MDTLGRPVGERSTYDGAILALETLASRLRKEIEPVPGRQGAFQLVGFQLRGTRPVRTVQVMRVEPSAGGWRVLAWRETEQVL